MRKILKVSILVVLFFVYTYILAIEAIPNSLIMFEGETLNIKTILRIKYKTRRELWSNTNGIYNR